MSNQPITWGTDGQLDATGLRFAVVVSRFNSNITERLVASACEALDKAGAEHVRVFYVPGAFELPLAAKLLAHTHAYHAIVALGAVIRGDTPHFDFVAGECARGIMDVQLATAVPIGFGVLTTENMAQAQERADPARGDKGYEAAIAAATLVTIPNKLPRAGFRA
jgi:6,7-dimethyl-8-ribityllumazine synthase